MRVTPIPAAISISVFRDAVEISDTALHARSWSKPHDKTLAFVVDPERNLMPSFNPWPVFLFVIAKKSFSNHQISMTLLAIFIFSAIFFLPVLWSVIPFSKPGQNPTGRNPVLGNIGVPGNLSTYIGCATHVLSCAPQSSIRVADTRKSKQTLGSQILWIFLYTLISL